MDEPRPSQKLDNFFTKQRKILYKKRDIILRAEDNPSGVLYLKKGYVRVFVDSKDGEELTYTIFKSGEIFPITWSFDEIENIHSFEALTDIELYRCSRNTFIAFLKTNPDVLFHITQVIVARYHGYLLRMEHLVFGNAKKQIASILSVLAERYGEETKGEIVIPIPLTHKDIASMVGLARETASIEIEKLEKKGILVFRKHILIVKDIVRLKEIL